MLARLFVVLVATGAIVGAVFLLRGDAILRRAAEAREDIVKATDMDHPDFRSDTGARILMAQLAIQAVREHPIGGVGAGGYRSWCRAWIKSRGFNPNDAVIHQHPHSSPLQIGATTGLIGLLLAGAAAVIALGGGFRELGPPGPTGGLGSYAAGPAFALLGLLLAGLFDPVHLNAQTGAIMAALMALCLVSRPTKDPFAQA